MTCGLLTGPLALAQEEVYLTNEQFVAQAFDGAAIKAETLWITKSILQQVTQILGHPPTQLRLRFWSHDARSAWILEEIGKEEPITAGFIVESGKLKQVQILAYRESRGSEVRYPAFLKQFVGIGLNADSHLDHKVDGVSGATLSVSALDRMARLALYFDQQVAHPKP